MKSIDATEEQSWFILFSDGGKVAYGVCAYICWKTKDERYESFLLAEKNRIVSTRQLTIQRLELCRAVLESLFILSLIKVMDIEFRRVIHLIDS